jgi:hypothetical protein
MGRRTPNLPRPKQRKGVYTPHADLVAPLPLRWPMSHRRQRGADKISVGCRLALVSPSLNCSSGKGDGSRELIFNKEQFDALRSTTSKPSNNNEASTSQVSVETSDEVVAQENDHLKLEVKRLEEMVSELVKQAKVRPSQDNYRNMVNNLEKGSTITNQVSQ